MTSDRDYWGRIEPIDETGHVYGRLTVKQRIPDPTRKAHLWECQCTCGAVRRVLGVVLRRQYGPTSCRACRTKREAAAPLYHNVTNAEHQHV